MLSRLTALLALLVATLTAPAGWTQKAASTAAAYLLLTKADEAINNQDSEYAPTVDLLQRAIKDDPKLVNARLHLAYFYLQNYLLTPDEKVAERNAFLRKTLAEWIALHPASSDAVWNMVW